MASPPIDRDELEQARGRGVRVLVLDSGVEPDHPSLREHPIACWQVADGEVRPEALPGDASGHGTAVASVLLRHAPAIELHSVRVLGQAGSCSSAVLQALWWGVREGYQVINCSFNVRSSLLGEFKAVVDEAFCRGLTLVASSDGQRTRYPGAFPTVVSTVCGQEPPDPSRLELPRRHGELVEFAAPGSRVRVAWQGGSYRTATGSSFAAPFLSALVARILELRPGWNPCQVKSSLYELATSS